MSPLNIESVYINEGNYSVLEFIKESDCKILDIGCGSGGNGKLVKLMYPNIEITGITCSEKECQLALNHLDFCVCCDLENEEIYLEKQFDVLLFCHVLEHLSDPVSVIRKCLPYLKSGGKLIIAVPNIANWRDRLKIALGNFEYTDSGVMDRTHLRFYTFYTAPRCLVEPVAELSLKVHKANGSVPLAFFRHHFLSPQWKEKIDKWGCRFSPNLFAREIIMVANRDEIE